MLGKTKFVMMILPPMILPFLFLPLVLGCGDKLFPAPVRTNLSTRAFGRRRRQRGEDL